MDRVADRSESPAERSDRNWADLLQELRVCQTGTQLIAGFLLTLPFTGEFSDLDSFGRGLYLGLVLLAAVTTGLTLTPISIHRRLFGQQVKERLVSSAHVLVHLVLGCIALLVTGICVLVFDKVTDRTSALVVGAAMLTTMALLLAVVPLRVSHRATSGDRSE
ncbi:DUF6328 family protein [Nocardioides donggukensis]|uniref:Sodium:proton antiporter n=1 Tax=Nocardioides donggukensis TaxID=2774019 RepID=A0A927K8Q3_9ACTN|nr:DUF6328 family protein [Nocardioides donggukensis]MBD8869816.1 sodium:proton antiporter [Nocardioides donggukensis]